jgi:uncharacterized protein (TIGR03437 family)
MRNRALTKKIFATAAGAAWLLPLTSQAQVPGYTIATAAGTGQCCGTSTPVSGPGPGVIVQSPFGMTFDPSGNLLIATNALLLKMDPAGMISTIGGGGSGGATLGDGGPATKATLSIARGVAVDAAGNIYVADSQNNRIRKISPDGTITTIAGPGSSQSILGDGGPATSATLKLPNDVAVDSAGNIFVADTNNSRVRKISPDGIINTVAGTGAVSNPASGALIGDGGPATQAIIGQPTGLAVDSAANLYIADVFYANVRKVSPDGIITTVAGTGLPSYSGDGGPARLAAVDTPQKLAVDRAGNLYIADWHNQRIRMVTPEGRMVSIAGNGQYLSTGDGGPATSAGLSGPQGVAVAVSGKVYISEGAGSPYSERIRVLTPTGTQVFPPPSVAPVGVATATAFGGFKHIAVGGWIEIYGSYMASGSRTWTAADFNGPSAPTSLDGTTVTIGGQPAFLAYISPGQINGQVPSTVGTGAQNVVVKTRDGTSESFVVTVNPEQPGLLMPKAFEIDPFPYVAATFPDGTFVLPPGAIDGVPSRRAQTGATITLYGVGFGRVSPSIPAGQVVQEGNSLVLPLRVFIAGQEATVTYAGLAPNSIGLYQFNVVVPKLPLGAGLAPLALNFMLGGVPGEQAAFIAVQ